MRIVDVQIIVQKGSRFRQECEGLEFVDGGCHRERKFSASLKDDMANIDNVV